MQTQKFTKQHIKKQTAQRNTMQNTMEYITAKKYLLTKYLSVICRNRSKIILPQEI